MIEEILWSEMQSQYILRLIQTLNLHCSIGFLPFLDNSLQTLWPFFHPAKPDSVLTDSLLLAFPRVVLTA